MASPGRHSELDHVPVSALRYDGVLRQLQALTGVTDELWLRLAAFVAHGYALCGDGRLVASGYLLGDDLLPVPQNPSLGSSQASPSTGRLLQEVSVALRGVPLEVLERSVRAELDAVLRRFDPPVPHAAGVGLQDSDLFFHLRANNPAALIRPPFADPQLEHLFAGLLGVVVGRARALGLHPGGNPSFGEWNSYLVEVSGAYAPLVSAVVYRRHLRMNDASCFTLPHFEGWPVEVWPKPYEGRILPYELRVTDAAALNRSAPLLAVQLPPPALLPVWFGLSLRQLERNVELYDVLVRDGLAPSVAMAAASRL